ncbi:MBL fold metallo-hydrolase [Verrucomicrobiota bacterium sgz303538]
MGKLIPQDGKVAIRMYRHGLGDCFLLAFPTDGKKPFYMLIDCGVILGTEDAVTTMRKVVRDITSATGGDIHLLVATHEHWDHVSGFVQAREAFEKLKIHNLWMAWTEDPKDELAQRLRKQQQKDKEAVRLAISRATDAHTVQHISQVLSFFGEPAGLAAASGNTTEAALNALREFVKKGGGKPTYLYPGEGPIEFPKIDGVGQVSGARIYVLGPPHSEKALRRINPSTKKEETYHENNAALRATDTFLAAAIPEESPLFDFELREKSYPFDRRLCVSPKQARRSAFFRERYGHGDPNHPEAWRRIDDDWLGTAAELALALDSYTNNTSVALAVELLPSKKVLLFVADAQVGNWLSWDELKWDDGDGEITIEDLMRRTVLYKVGHHGSHNATMREKGLERMTHEDLIALIPVDEQVAHEKKNWKKMPFIPLMERLAEKTKGRLLRNDRAFPSKPTGVQHAEWKCFDEAVQRADTLYFDISLPIESSE